MPLEPTTNFKDSNGVDLGKKLVTKDYLLTVYGSILESLGNSGLTVTPALWIWGKNNFGQLGINDTTNRNTPVTTLAGGINWKSVASGYEHSTAIKTDGTLWTWGRNQFGQLGIDVAGGTTNRTTPVTTFAGGTNWKSVECGYSHTVAIKTDGTLWTWGYNAFGHLGNNTFSNRTTPVTTFAGGTNWKSVAGGREFTAAIKTDGTLWTWGYNVAGQLGTNDTTNRLTPVTTLAGGTNWKSVACGNAHIAAIKTDGTLWTWGRNVEAQLGINVAGATENRTTPVTTFAGGTNWKSVALGFAFTTAIKTDGTLWTWGRNTEGQLGINVAGATEGRTTPVTTFAGGTNWKSSAGGDSHTAAIKTDGTLWTWGRNTEGQLGINDTTRRSTPVTTFAGGNDWKSVASLGYHTVAIDSVDYI